MQSFGETVWLYLLTFPIDRQSCNKLSDLLALTLSLCKFCDITLLTINPNNLSPIYKLMFIYFRETQVLFNIFSFFSHLSLPLKWLVAVIKVIYRTLMTCLVRRERSGFFQAEQSAFPQEKLKV